MSDKPDLVQRRQRYIQRQIELDRGAVDVMFAGARPEGSGPPNRHGMPRLPVGQHEVKNWPVLDLGEQPDVALDKWKLEIAGLVENPVTLTWHQFLELPQAEDVSDFHCVTTWSRYDNHWRGVRFKTIAELVVPKDEASVRALHRVRLHARLVHSVHGEPAAWRVQSKTMCCSSTHGRAGRSRASTAVPAA